MFVTYSPLARLVYAVWLGFAENDVRKVKVETSVEMERIENLTKIFSRIDKIVDMLTSLGVHLPVEGVTLKIVEVLHTTNTSNAQLYSRKVSPEQTSKA